MVMESLMYSKLEEKRKKMERVLDVVREADERMAIAGPGEVRDVIMDQRDADIGAIIAAGDPRAAASAIAAEMEKAGAPER